jgi:hypothetical protein
MPISNMKDAVVGLVKLTNLTNYQDEDSVLFKRLAGPKDSLYSFEKEYKNKFDDLMSNKITLPLQALHLALADFRLRANTCVSDIEKGVDIQFESSMMLEQLTKLKEDSLNFLIKFHEDKYLQIHKDFVKTAKKITQLDIDIKKLPEQLSDTNNKLAEAKKKLQDLQMIKSNQYKAGDVAGLEVLDAKIKDQEKICSQVRDLKDVYEVTGNKHQDELSKARSFLTQLTVTKDYLRDDVLAFLGDIGKKMDAVADQIKPDVSITSQMDNTDVSSREFKASKVQAEIKMENIASKQIQEDSRQSVRVK